MDFTTFRQVEQFVLDTAGDLGLLDDYDPRVGTDNEQMTAIEIFLGCPPKLRMAARDIVWPICLGIAKWRARGFPVDDKPEMPASLRRRRAGK